jgi:hypothetical protein
MQQTKLNKGSFLQASHRTGFWMKQKKTNAAQATECIAPRYSNNGL